MSEWQPIETAPKDGDVILVHAKFGEKVMAASWGLARVHGKARDGGGISDETYPWLTFDPGTDGLNAHKVDAFTHWMPLPPPPASGA